MENAKKQNLFNRIINGVKNWASEAWENINQVDIPGDDEKLSKADIAELQNARKVQKELHERGRIKLPSVGETHPEKAQNLDKREPSKSKPRSKGYPTVEETEASDGFEIGE